MRRITITEAMENFLGILEEIEKATNGDVSKIIDFHNKIALEREIDNVADRIRRQLGDKTLVFEMYLDGAYSDFYSEPTPDVASGIIDEMTKRWISGM